MQDFLIMTIPAAIWGLTPAFYRPYIEKTSASFVNFFRISISSLTLLIPFLLLGFNAGAVYGGLSGMLTLAVGDTLYFASIRLIGASIATPILFTQMILIQFIAAALGEPLSPVYLVSAALIMAGVYLLSRGGAGSLRKKGIGIALLAAVVEGVGQASLKLATDTQLNPLSISFSRAAVGSMVLATAMLVSKRNTSLSMLSRGEYIRIAFLGICDVALASSLYIFSVGFAGLVYSTIILGLSPLVTQVVSKLSNKEAPGLSDFAGGLMIVGAIAATVL